MEKRSHGALLQDEQFKTISNVLNYHYIITSSLITYIEKYYTIHMVTHFDFIVMITCYLPLPSIPCITNVHNTLTLAFV